MKTIIFAAMALVATAAQAVPIVNENVANYGIITMYPDHADPNRYYIAPNVVTLALDGAGLPVLSYNEYVTNEGYSRAMLQMNLTAAYTRTELEEAKNAILAKNPNAQFSGLPFSESVLQFTTPIKELIKQNDCNHVAGLIGQEQGCVIILSLRGRNIFRDSVRRKKLFVTLQFVYKVKAFIKNAAGALEDYEIKHGIAARIHGEQLALIPDLLKK